MDRDVTKMDSTAGFYTGKHLMTHISPYPPPRHFFIGNVLFIYSSPQAESLHTPKVMWTQIEGQDILILETVNATMVLTHHLFKDKHLTL